MRISAVVACMLAGLFVAGCATKPKVQTQLPTTSVDRSITTASFQADSPLEIKPPQIEQKASELDKKDLSERVQLKLDRPAYRSSGLAGRTMRVSSLRDINLGPKEVILTFDDGPAPGRTERILDTLDQYGVKATFFMVGQMATYHPELAKKVALRGHAIGSHTYDHDNLAKESFSSALENIRRGERAVRAATGGEGAAFFRFPYLASTQKLRTHLASRGTVVLDADVDSKDYYKVSPAQVVRQTMSKLRKRGKGIILLHDLHHRTASALPTLLNRLRDEGYKVVDLQPAYGSNAAIALLD